MRKFWGVCNNDKYLVGCNGNTIYIYDNNEKEIAKFKDDNHTYIAKFIPNTNILVAKSTTGFLLIYNLDELKLVKRIKFSEIGGAQDEGFKISSDGKYLYNIEKPIDSTKTQLTIYDTSNFNAIKTLFADNNILVLENLEFDEDNNCYVLGFMRNKKGIFNYGFVGKLLNDEITEIYKINENRYWYIMAYKEWEDHGFTDKKLEWSYYLKGQDNTEKISLSNIHKSFSNQIKSKIKSIISRIFKK